MQNFLAWSLPLFRAFGITVRIHLLYILFTVGLVIRLAYKTPELWLELTAVFVVMFFLIVLFHEFGHCFAARRVGGEASEIIIWPLGGLAACELPHRARAHLICALGGPFVNAVCCVGCGIALFAATYVPPLNPFGSGFYPVLYNWQEETWSTAPTKNLGARIFFFTEPNNQIREIAADRVAPSSIGMLFGERDGVLHPVGVRDYPQYPDWVLWTARFFWLNWILLLLNMIPAFPLDGGRVLQAWLWGRGDQRYATETAVWIGYASAVCFVFVSFFTDGVTWLALAMFMFLCCALESYRLQTSYEESTFGYDFSQGYTSLERDEEEAPRPVPRRPNFIRRWLQARAERRRAREQEQRAAEDQRMDELLAKITAQGKESLTDEERRFMDRVSARYRNRSS